MSLTSLVKFIPRYLIFLVVVVAIINGIIFLVSLSDSSLLVYKNAIDVPVLILSSNFTKFIRSKSFVAEPIGFSMYKITLFVNNESFISSFPVWVLFISSSCLIAGTRTSSAMLNNNG